MQRREWSRAPQLLTGLTFFPVSGETPMCSPDLISTCLIPSPQWDSLQRSHWHLQTFPDIRSLGIRSLNGKQLESLVWLQKAISSLQQFKTPLNACCNLLLVCKDSTPKNRRTRTKRFSSTVGTLILTKRILSRNFLKHLSIKFSG